jgi:4'-phosphopantetheinyl transferase EntD
VIDLTARLAARGVILQTRPIAVGDEDAFADPSEPLARRRASGAARIAARAALAALGGDVTAPLPRTPRGYPLWSAGFVGSLAHDAALAVALVAPAVRFAAVGVDVEPCEPLPDDVTEIALLPTERRAAAADPPLGRAIFAAKEAVYKAINPFDGTALEYEDIEVDVANGCARLRDGRWLELDWARGRHWIVAALAPMLRFRA